ncbi:MAG: hypothetical protein PHU94_01860 [Bacilli bacterium]|nr:hypothetical protein [Bacilli bacterium]MDD4734270.1 hypothetical protein [Bacilli bacterium]
MDMIKTIEINKIKGIDNLKLELNMIPNKPSIFVAPNGFGKSSITVAFDSISQNKLNIMKEYWYNGKEHTDSYIKIEETRDDIDKEYIVNNSSNSMNQQFDIYVINNKVTSEAKLMNINGHSIAKSDMIIKDVILCNTIPTKENLKYSVLQFRSRYKTNKWIIPNIDVEIQSSSFILKISKCKKSLDSILGKKRINENILNLENKFQEKQIRQVDFITSFEHNDLIKIILNDSDISYISNIFSSYLENKNDLEKVIYIIQIINLYKNNKDIFLKVYKRTVYDLYKLRTQELINSIDNKGRIVAIKEEKGSLLAKMVKASMISNGEIDLICFILLLEKIRYASNNKDAILIIDEVFDYLDDINIIIVQKYISMFINSFSKCDKKIYPIIMTHLDPNVFKNFYFAKMKIYYLSNFNLKINEEVKKIVTDRSNISEDNISKYYLHYHNESCDLSKEFYQVGLTDKFCTSQKFKTEVYNELDKYISDKQCDYLMVLCALRIKIEEYIYLNLDEKYKQKMLDINMTVNKIIYAEDVNLPTNENFKFLSVLYNDFMHLDKKADPQNKKVLFLSSKLDNLFIKRIIKETINIINNN